jgi:D-methionine transport system permease protein
MFRYDVRTIILKIVLPGLRDTIIMHISSVLACTFFGFILALILVTTDSRGLRPNRIIYTAVSTYINIVRSVPFIITIITIIPLTRIICHTSIGIRAAVFYITVAGSPLVARLLETCLKEVNPALIEAAKSFGASDMQITFHVIIKESIPSIVSTLTLATVSVLGFTAMAGTIGAGGLGAVALQWGYQNFDNRIMYGTVLILIFFVSVIQFSGNAIYRKVK